MLGDDGQKMSKSLRNYPDPMNVFETYGADAMRWYLLSSPILRGGDFSVTEAGIRETVRQVALPLWNTWYFLSLYANAEGATGKWSTASTNVLDRYVLAKTHDLIDDLTDQLDAYDLSEACATIRSFLDAMTNWYVRRSRDRFWSGDQEAIDTLHTVLHVLCRVIAPLQPLLAEEIFRGLTGERSVHLTDWPSAADLPADSSLVVAMDGVRDICSTALSVRKAHGRRVRLPLRSLTVASPDLTGAAAFSDIIRDEVNVRDVHFSVDVGSVATRELQVLPKALGPRLGAQVQSVIAAVKKGQWTIDNGVPVVGGIMLLEGEFTLRVVAAPGSASAALGAASGVVVLDVEVTPELEAEGAARDMVRTLQQTRRALGLNVSDRVRVAIDGPSALLAQLEGHLSLISGEVLATSVILGAGSGEPLHEEMVDGSAVRVWMVVAS